MSISSIQKIKQVEESFKKEDGSSWILEGLGFRLLLVTFLLESFIKHN